MSAWEREVLAHEAAMQRAMANAQKRTGDRVLSTQTTEDGVVIETVPFVELTDEDFED